MSWYVESLLLNKEIIRVNQTKKNRDFTESSEFLDLLTVENTLKEFKEHDLLSSLEIKVLDAILEYGIANAKYKLQLDRETISKIFKRVCNRIAFKLGDYFTDEGYLAYLATKYNLSDRKIKRIHSYMTSKFRHKLARNIYEEE